MLKGLHLNDSVVNNVSRPVTLDRCVASRFLLEY